MGIRTQGPLRAAPAATSNQPEITPRATGQWLILAMLDLEIATSGGLSGAVVVRTVVTAQSRPLPTAGRRSAPSSDPDARSFLQGPGRFNRGLHVWA